VSFSVVHTKPCAAYLILSNGKDTDFETEENIAKYNRNMELSVII